MTDGRTSLILLLLHPIHAFLTTNANGNNTVNPARALRIGELISDFRAIQHRIAAINVHPSTQSREEFNEEGFVVLRQAQAEAKAILDQPFQTSPRGKLTEEMVKVQLRRIIADAAVRRFRTQKAFLRATAALRWVNSRAAVLQAQARERAPRSEQGQSQRQRIQASLLQIRNALRAELSQITDQRVESSLRSADLAAGKWLVEDPSFGGGGGQRA